MSLSNADITRLLIAIVLLLVAAHGGGQLCVRLRQPRVAGEIIGGLLLGPTLFATVLPQWQEAIFSRGVATGPALFYQLGLFLLMFCSGAALRAGVRSGERRTAIVIASVGNVVPFAAGILFLVALKPGNLIGPAHNDTAFLLVFGCAIAVTSVPVIAKIMADLGIMGTPFARIVLTVAVFEDIVLFVVISVALGMVQPASAQAFSLPSLLGIKPDTLLSIVYFVAASAAFFSLPLVLGRAFLQRIAAMRGNLFAWSSPVAFQLLFLLVVTALALFLGVAAYFGAFVAGILAGRLEGVNARAHEAIKSFSFAVFIPIYFAIVGLQLDLLQHFDVVFFVGFLAYACAAKALSSYAGARFSGQPKAAARDLAVALNARGGPAIVLASVAYAARIINESFYVSLVMLALVTPIIARACLAAIPRTTSREDVPSEDAGEAVSAATASDRPSPVPEPGCSATRP